MRRQQRALSEPQGEFARLAGKKTRGEGDSADAEKCVVAVPHEPDSANAHPSGAVLIFRSGHVVLTRQRKRSLAGQWRLANRLTNRYKDELWRRKVKEDAEEVEEEGDFVEANADAETKIEV